jgi:hypothetical protein
LHIHYGQAQAKRRLHEHGLVLAITPVTELNPDPSTIFRIDSRFPFEYRNSCVSRQLHVPISWSADYGETQFILILEPSTKKQVPLTTEEMTEIIHKAM